MIVCDYVIFLIIKSCAVISRYRDLLRKTMTIRGCHSQGDIPGLSQDVILRAIYQDHHRTSYSGRYTKTITGRHTQGDIPRPSQDVIIRAIYQDHHRMSYSGRYTRTITGCHTQGDIPGPSQDVIYSSVGIRLWL